MRIAVLTLAMFTITIGIPALADDGVQELARDGNWVAIAHSSSSETIDVCVAVDNAGDLGFRDDGTGLEVRTQNSAWSLPSNVRGKVTLTADQYSFDLEISDNSSTAVAMMIPRAEVAPLLDALAAAKEVSIKAGSSPERLVSMAGASRVLTAFRTCAGLGGGGNPSPESNPFRAD